jgi:two-component system, LuxR family, sensor histidine kinase DctS
MSWTARLPTQRTILWLALLLLVISLLATLIWLAGRYESEQLQQRVERDAQDAASDIRAGLTRNIQSLQALRSTAAQWQSDAENLLRTHRELVRLEWRDPQFKLIASRSSPYFPGFTTYPRDSSSGDLQLSCERARRQTSPVYVASHFAPAVSGQGLELMEICLALGSSVNHEGYLVAVYGLQSLLTEMINKSILRGQDVSFTEPDGTRLALQGNTRRGGRMFTGQQLLDLPGNTIVMRVDSWRSAPDLFPNVLTALVTMMSIALVIVIGLLGRDIGKRLRAERELADALAFRKAMENSLMTGLRARDMQGSIRYVNPAFCAMTGFEAQELLGKSSPMPYWPPELIDEYQQRQAVRLSGNLATREGYESVFMRKDGSRFPVLVFEAPLIDAQSRQTGWMSAVLDISEQRRMEELSRASQERLQASARLATVGEMASLLSHELNQPLAAISSYATGTANMLQADALPTQDVQHALSRIAEQAERAGKVIKSVHDFVRRRETQHETVAAAKLLDAVMPLVQLQARKLGVQVHIHCPDSLDALLVDRTMVEQVLLNLARNAIQAMESTPLGQRLLQITVKPAQGAGWLEISVADRGLGIDPETAKQLFTPFFSTRVEGMGLGLSLCRTVVEQHGGVLRYENHPAGGTIFIFTLPTAKPVNTNGS